MKEVGIDIGGQLVKQLTKGMVDTVKNIVVLCEIELCPQYIRDMKNVIYIEIDDPPDSDKTIEVLRKMRDEIEEVVLELVAAK